MTEGGYVMNETNYNDHDEIETTTNSQNTENTYTTAPVTPVTPAAPAAPVQHTEYTYSTTPVTPAQSTEYTYSAAPASTPVAPAAPAQSTEYTYGSGAPVDISGNDYTSKYGTSYRYEPSAPRRKESHMPSWLKVALSAVAFGLIAAAVFIGVNFLYDSLVPDATPAVTEESASKDRRIINNSTNVKKDEDDNTVASTQILTGNEGNFADVSAVVENSMPSIVQINCTFNTQSFFGTYQSTGAGSGIIIGQTDDELMIATNNHVVENALDVKVTFNNNTDAEAYVKGTDAYADLAVVAVDISKLDQDTIDSIKVATIGNSDDVKVGQMAIAIGNALGYGTSTTVGYISAKDREVDIDGKTMTLLQTDAAINPGNSGGALLNIKGEVIGINSVKYASSSVEGMGFAIPISRAVDILNDLATREVLKDEEKGYLGVRMETVTTELAEAYGWPVGVYVYEVLQGSAAENAGILSGDIITAINDRSVQTNTDLRNEITSYKAGTTVTIVLQRLERGRFKEMEVEVKLGTNPEYAG